MIYSIFVVPFPDAGYVNLYGRDITERKQAEEALATRTLQLEAVRAVTAEITQELDLVTLLGLINRRAAEMVRAPSAALLLWDETAQVLVPQVWHGHGDRLRGIHYRLGEGLAGEAAERREGIVVNDYPAYERTHPVILKHSGITAAIAAPLLYRNQLLGVIKAIREGPGRGFTEEDKSLITLFASQAAIAIENASLYQEVQRHLNELEVRVQKRTQELASVNEQLQAASRHKSEFLANMSHELRTPLNSILGFAQILMEQTGITLSPKQMRFLTHIYNSGQHLLQLINDILDLSKVEAGKFVLQPERLPVAETLEDILVIARGLANKKGQTIRPEIARDLPWLYADPVRFKQILFNLLSNAVKFTPERGTITIRAQRVPAIADCGLRNADWGTGSEAGHSAIRTPQSEMRDFLEIAVTDTGIGIKAEDLPRLFQEFVQLGGAKSQEGTGLGLALTKRLVEMHGGRIWAESLGEGLGSTFTVVLPFAGPTA
jgi:signal transduction histidine kinase